MMADNQGSSEDASPRARGTDRARQRLSILQWNWEGPFSTGLHVNPLAGAVVCLFVGWLLNVPATCQCISGTDLHRQFYVLPH